MMKKLFLTALLLVSVVVSVQAQADRIYTADDLDYRAQAFLGTDYDKSVIAEYELAEQLVKRFKLPADAKHLKTRLKAGISFVVEKNSKLTDVVVKVIPVESTLTVPQSVPAAVKSLFLKVLAEKRAKFSPARVRGGNPVRQRVDLEVYFYFAPPSTDDHVYSFGDENATPLLIRGKRAYPGVVIASMVSQNPNKTSFLDPDNNGAYIWIVEKDGSVSNFEVLVSSGDSRCDQYVKDWTKKMKFCPAIRDGYAVRSKFIFRVMRRVWFEGLL